MSRALFFFVVECHDIIRLVIVMIDELILNIQESSRAVPARFGEVGHRVNLTALKGEIILSDVTLDDKG